MDRPPVDEGLMASRAMIWRMAYRSQRRTIGVAIGMAVATFSLFEWVIDPIASRSISGWDLWAVAALPFQALATITAIIALVVSIKASAWRHTKRELARHLDNQPFEALPVWRVVAKNREVFLFTEWDDSWKPQWLRGILAGPWL